MVCYPEPSGKAPLGTGTSCPSVTGPLQRSEQQQNSQSANILRLFWLHVAAKVEPRFTSSAGRPGSVLKTRLHSEREQHRVSNGPGHDALCIWVAAETLDIFTTSCLRCCWRRVSASGQNETLCWHHRAARLFKMWKHTTEIQVSAVLHHKK